VENDVETSYTNWVEGEPNNYDGHEDCVEIDYTKGFEFGDLSAAEDGWNDHPCSNYRRHFICELKL
jgi:hypothetical protein